MSRGSTDEVRSFGRGLDDRKPLLIEGMEDDDANSLL